MTTSQSANLAARGEVKRGSHLMEPKAHQTCDGEAPTARSGFFTSALDRASNLIGKLALALGAAFLVLMALNITLDVVLRLVFGGSFPGTLEVVSFYYMVYAVFLPLAFVERRGEHIEVDAFFNLMPARAQRVLLCFSFLISLAYFGALTWQSLMDAVAATQNRQTAMANFTFYIWPARWALVAGFGAACLAILTHLCHALSQLGKPKEEHAA